MLLFTGRKQLFGNIFGLDSPPEIFHLLTDDDLIISDIMDNTLFLANGRSLSNDISQALGIPSNMLNEVHANFTYCSTMVTDYILEIYALMDRTLNNNLL